jgi:hypothetical protein
MNDELSGPLERTRDSETPPALKSSAMRSELSPLGDISQHYDCASLRNAAFLGPEVAETSGNRPNAGQGKRTDAS